MNRGWEWGDVLGMLEWEGMRWVDRQEGKR